MKDPFVHWHLSTLFHTSNPFPWVILLSVPPGRRSTSGTAPTCLASGPCPRTATRGTARAETSWVLPRRSWRTGFSRRTASAATTPSPSCASKPPAKRGIGGGATWPHRIPKWVPSSMSSSSRRSIRETMIYEQKGMELNNPNLVHVRSFSVLLFSWHCWGMTVSISTRNGGEMTVCLGYTSAEQIPWGKRSQMIDEVTENRTEDRYKGRVKEKKFSYGEREWKRWRKRKKKEKWKMVPILAHTVWSKENILASSFHTPGLATLLKGGTRGYLCGIRAAAAAVILGNARLYFLYFIYIYVFFRLFSVCLLYMFFFYPIQSYKEGKWAAKTRAT